MTPEERAKRVVELLDISDSEGVIEDAILSAVLEEREACAKIADDRSECGDPDVFHAAQSIADLIRGRAP